MEKEFFLNGGIHNPSLQYEHPFSWHTMEIQTSQSPDCFLSTPPPNDQFESALSSMVSSPAASNSPLSNDNFMIRELIGKLGSICNSGDITNNSCYSTPLSSPPKMGIPMPNMDHLVKENLPILGNLPAMLGDPGFAERAARFSSFGSRSFNGRTTQFGMNNSTKNSNNGNGEMGYPSNFSKLGGNGKLQRVSSSPSLKEVGSQVENNKNLLLISNIDRKHGGKFGQECNNSRESSSISGQNLGGENGSNRKRKAPANKGKSKELQSQPHLPSSSNKVDQNGEDSSAKRSKSDESGETKREENRVDDGKKQSNGNQKPPEPPKDYIHVRARRGQATDSHSLAERVRREKISERMKLLQDLVPGCDKVTGKALMLDEIINYVQSLQRQVEFLSMKLASVNPRLDFNMGNLFSKEVIQPNCSLTHPMYPIDSLAPNLYGQPHQNPLQDSIPTTAPPPMQPHQIHALHLPSIDPFSTPLPQLPSLCEGDLQSIVQMGYGLKENGFQSQPLHGSNPSPLMKIEF